MARIDPEKRFVSYVIYFGILVAIIFSAVYLFYFSQPYQLGPKEDSIRDYSNARALLLKLGDDGIDWYCGRIESFADAQGNAYGAQELVELKRLLGNENQLRAEFCS